MREKTLRSTEGLYRRPAEVRSEPVAAARCDASEAEDLAEVLFWEADLEAFVLAFWVEPWVAWAEELFDLRRAFECLEGLLITVDCCAATGR